MTCRVRSMWRPNTACGNGSLLAKMPPAWWSRTAAPLSSAPIISSSSKTAQSTRGGRSTNCWRPAKRCVVCGVGRRCSGGQPCKGRRLRLRPLHGCPPLQFRIFELPPQTICNNVAVTLQAVARYIATDVVDIALKQGARVGVEARVNCLRKVNDTHLILPVQHIIGREVSVDAVVGEPEFDVAHQAIKNRIHFVPGKFDALE